MDTEQKSASGAVVASTANTRLTGSRLIITRTVWLVLVIPSLGLFLASLLVSYQQMQTVCVDPVMCNASGGLSVGIQQSIASIGFSVVGLLIFWRRSDDWLALLAAFFLVMFNITSSGNTANALALAYPILDLPLSIVNFLGQVSLLVFFLLFPSGRPVPRWMGLILLLVILEQFLSIFPSVTANWPAWLGWLGPLIVYGTIIFSQIYRYRRVSTSVQRQQTKWIIFGLAVAFGVVIGIWPCPSSSQAVRT